MNPSTLKAIRYLAITLLAATFFAGLAAGLGIVPYAVTVILFCVGWAVALVWVFNS